MVLVMYRPNRSIGSGLPCRDRLGSVHFRYSVVPGLCTRRQEGQHPQGWIRGINFVDTAGLSTLYSSNTESLLFIQKRSPAQWNAVRYAYMDCRRYATRRQPQPLTILGTEKIWDSSLAG